MSAFNPIGKRASFSPLQKAEAKPKFSPASAIKSAESAAGESSEEAPASSGPSTAEYDSQVQARQRAEQELADLQAEKEALLSQLAAEREIIAELAAGLEAARRQALLEIRAAFGEAVMAATRRIITVEPSASEEAFRGRLDEISERLVLEEEVTLTVAPANLELAQELLSARPGWQVQVDTDIDQGCVAHCRNGMLDARIETALDGLEEAVQAWLTYDAELDGLL